MESSISLTYYHQLEFSNVDGKSLAMNLFIPESTLAKVPVIVWIYGGAYLYRNNFSCPILHMVQRGYAVASIDYRLSSEALFPAQIIDCKAAVRWLRANADQYKLDAERIGAWGESSGGHLASMLGVTSHVTDFDGQANSEYSSRVQAVCDFFGPTDFLRMDDASSDIVHNAANSPASLLIGGPIQENKDLVAKANPIMYISEETAPFLIIHGEEDRIVPHQQSILFHEALLHQGVDVQFHLVKGAGHDHFVADNMREQVHNFFDKHLKLGN